MRLLYSMIVLYHLKLSSLNIFYAGRILLYKKRFKYNTILCNKLICNYSHLKQPQTATVYTVIQFMITAIIKRNQHSSELILNTVICSKISVEGAHLPFYAP